MSRPPEPAPAVVAFCPYCGEPLGSFFGSRLADDTRCCDRCGECFGITRVTENGSNETDLRAGRDVQGER